MPNPQVHPLPDLLAQWQDLTQAGDYFDRVAVLPVGYLVWSEFPVMIAIEADQTDLTWNKAIHQAIQEWQAYLPLKIVAASEQADIRVVRSGIPISRPPGSLELPRVRTAETRYETYADPQADGRSILKHRCTVVIRPGQAPLTLLAAARHELGHALGIWGHSQNETDVMYFSQVKTPPHISPRDVNTLKRIYQQPTRLGWPLP